MGLTLQEQISVFRFIISFLYPKHNSYLLTIFVAIKYLIDTKRKIKYGNMNFHETGFKLKCLPREIHKAIVKIQINGHFVDFHHQLIIPKSFFEDLYCENIYFRDKQSLWISVKIIRTKNNPQPKVTHDYASNIKKIIKINTSNLSSPDTINDKDDVPRYLTSSKQVSVMERIVQIVPSFDENEHAVCLSEHEYFNFVKPVSSHYSDSDVILKFCAISDLCLAPQVADQIVLQMINIPVNVGTDLVDTIIEVYFSVPRFLHKDDHFSIPLKEKFMGHLYFKYFSLVTEYRFLYFTCKNITKNSPELKNTKIDKQKSMGYFIIKGETEIIQEQNISSYIPFQKLLCIKHNIKLHSNSNIEDFYVTSCPFGLDQYMSDIESAVLPFLIDKQANSILSELKCVIKPIFLILGKAGSCRSLLISLLAMRNGLHLLKANCHQLISTTAKQTEAKLDALLQKAKRCSPIIVYLEDFEHFGVDSENKEDIRIVDSFRNSLNNLFERYNEQPIIIFASCDIETELKPNLKRIFLDEFKINAPNKSERLQLLHWLAITKNILFYDENFSKPIKSKSCEANVDDEKNKEKDDQIFKYINGKQYNLNKEFKNALLKAASKTETFVFDDLDSLMHLAVRNAHLRLNDQNENYFSVNNNLTSTPVQAKDLEIAIATLHSIYNNKLAPLNIPKVEWEDIGGLDELKKEVFRTIELPLKFPHLMSNSGLKRSGILLWGPPGCGKTLIARAIASQLCATFLSVKGPELLDMYVGQSEKNMRDIFSSARSSAPCVIFFDEAEAVAGARGATGDAGGAADRLVSQLLAELDGVASLQLNSNSDAVIVIAATNRPDLVESALLRPGRLDKLLYVGPYKGLHDKMRVLTASCRGYNICDSVDLNTVAEQLPEKCTGADLASIVNHARHQALSRIIKKIEEGDHVASEVSEKDIIISQNDFQSALTNFTPSISSEELDYYESLKTRLS